MQFETLLLEKRDNHVALLTLNRPEALNALNNQMRADLLAAFNYLRDDADVRALVLTGAGRAFCAGADVKLMAEAHLGPVQVHDRMRMLHRWLTALATMEKPTIAAVNGAAAGAGANLALACDLIVAAENARFVQAFVRVGLVPDAGGTFFLPRRVGLAKAKELMFTGEAIDAREAERIGLINRVVPADHLLDEALGWAERLAQGPTRAIGMAKELLNRSYNLSLDEVLALEGYAQAVAYATEDHREGVQAFTEKRPPRFQGR